MLYNPISAQSFPGLVLLGVAVLVSLRLFYYGRKEEPEDALHLSLSVVGRVMIAIGLLESCVTFLSGLALILLAAAFVVLAEEYWKYRASRQAALLAVLATAAQKSMPLPPAIEAFSYEWRGGFGHRARRLARLAAEGAPLSQALRQTGGMASAKALAVIEAGESSGALGPALGEAARLYLPRSAIDKMAALYWYLFFTMTTLISINTFAMLKLVPAMIKIFDDFDAQLPGVTLVLINVSNYFVAVWPLALLMQLLVIGLFTCLALRYFGLFVWDPPAVSALVRRWNMATVLRTSAIAAEANQPLERPWAALAAAYPNPSLQRRLTKALGDVSLGCDWCESLAQNGLLRDYEAALLKSAARAGNLPWALRETASGIERQCVLRVRLLSQLLTPVLVLALGAATSLIVIGLFLPLVTLIEQLL